MPDIAVDREEKIREIAYHLWDAAGRPANREDEFWTLAENEYERHNESGQGKGTANSGVSDDTTANQAINEFDPSGTRAPQGKRAAGDKSKVVKQAVRNGDRTATNGENPKP